MAGDQKSAAKLRAEKKLAEDPEYFKKLAAKKKGMPNPSATKFKKNDKRTKKLAAKGGKQSALQRVKLEYELLPSDPGYKGKKS